MSDRKQEPEPETEPTAMYAPNQQAVRPDGSGPALEDTGSQPQPEPQAQAAQFDPADHTVAEVQAHVEAHPDEISAVLAAEQSGKARATLISWLEADEAE